MKGFYTDYGYCGQIDNENYQLFATLDEYLEYLSYLDKEKDVTRVPTQTKRNIKVPVRRLNLRICPPFFIIQNVFRYVKFPKEFLKQSGLVDKSKYNQVANYAYLDTGVNISIGMKAPNDYFSGAFEQCRTKVMKIGTITDEDELKENLRINCIPESIVNMTADDYPDFLAQRRVLMAKKIPKECAISAWATPSQSRWLPEWARYWIR